jgi:hypothetical protein
MLIGFELSMYLLEPLRHLAAYSVTAQRAKYTGDRTLEWNALACQHLDADRGTESQPSSPFRMANLSGSPVSSPSSYRGKLSGHPESPGRPPPTLRDLCVVLLTCAQQVGSQM